MNSEVLLMDEDEILEEVDEYLLYSHYLGFSPELRVRYKSPVREPHNEDSRASWSMFLNKSKSPKMAGKEYGWKDNGTGLFGDIYDLVQLVLKLRSRGSAVEQVKRDFLLGNPQARQQQVYKPLPPPPAHIKIKSAPFRALDLAWWKQFNVDEQLLRQYNVSRVSYYWVQEGQHAPSFPSDQAYAYRIWDHYKLYFPLRGSDFKFRNDFDDRHLEGFCQLRFDQPLLIITKSLKDVMVLRSLGYESVSPRGEHSRIPEVFLNGFRERYDQIVVLFDNDGKHRGWDYPFPLIEVPIESGEKDISDYCRHYGPDATRTLLQKLLSTHPVMQIDLNKKMTRPELEQELEKIYLNRVISIQNPGSKPVGKVICGKVDRLAVDYDPKNLKELVCTVMIHDKRYVFGIEFFIQKAQIHGHSHGTD